MADEPPATTPRRPGTGDGTLFPIAVRIGRMSRGVGLTTAARAALPPDAVAALAALTHLGDPPVLVAIAALAYWLWDRDRGVHLLSLTICALALVVALKGLFALPRPPETLHAVPADGYGFPSGHALGAAALIGGVAVSMESGSWARRSVIGGILVTTVAVSRVGLGVHYAIDVLAGVGTGLLLLVVHRRLARDDPGRGFALAAVFALAGLVTAGLTRDALALAGLAVGGVIGLRLTPTPPVPPRRRDLPIAAGGVPLMAGLGLLAAGPWAPAPVVPVAAGALTAGILVVPSLPSLVRDTSTADTGAADTAGQSAAAGPDVEATGLHDEPLAPLDREN